jgi:Asp-tRNA(Asn)/Glu-tRNA(Gln) amidotransferase A subunit family amidase
LDHREAFKKVVDASLFREGAQALTPATLGPAPDRSTTGDGLFNGPWSYTGHPTVSLPVGRAENGLPLAVQIVGQGGQDLPELFASAGWLERRIGFDMRLPPTPDESASREM